MHLLPEAREKGWGTEMINVCLQFAKSRQFKQCYIGTMPNMKEAQALYQRFGCEYLEAPLGNTRHCSCSVWMLKQL